MNFTHTHHGLYRRRQRLLSVGRAMSTMATYMMVMVVAGLGGTVTSASGDECPNARLRVKNNSTALPDCRGYELVSSAYKEGFAPVAITALQASRGFTDSDAVAYISTGNFAGNGLGAIFNQYIARRSATGWLTTSPNPSGPDYAASIGQGAEALSADLRFSLWLMRRPDESTDLLDYYLRGPDGTFTRIGPAINPATRPPGSTGTAGPIIGPKPVSALSADLSHFLFQIDSSLVFPGDPSLGPSLYEYVGTGNARPRLVGVDNTGHLVSGGACPGGMSTDGRVIFFVPGCPGSVWARVNGTTSIEASASECTRTASDPGGVCTGPDDASFVGMASDGSRVFFTTTKQLLNGDTDQANDLYACDIPSGTPAPIGIANPCAGLTQVSGAATGANVESVFRVSEDGSRVYFVAQGVLATNQGAKDMAAVAGDHNLYVWQKSAAYPAGRTTFVAKLDGNVFPNDIATTADGRYLVFSTSTSLVDSGPGADTDGATDVYRYDAESGAMVRLSTASSGGGGNDPGFPAGQSRNGAMTADARTVIFYTSEPLSPLDTDTASDVYEWHDGQVSQITSGGAEQAAITVSGKDIFFFSSEQVTAADGDTNVDIYDARVGGGFDLIRPAPCANDACQGQHSAPPGLGAPRSGRLSGDSDVIDAAPMFSLRAVSAAQRKQLAATGKVSLRVTANTPATLSATATAPIAGRSVAIASARRTMATPGTVTLTLALSKKARKQLAKAGKLTVKVVVSDSKVAVPRSTTIKLTHAMSKKTKSRAARRTAARRSSVARAVTAVEGGRS